MDIEEVTGVLHDLEELVTMTRMNTEVKNNFIKMFSHAIPNMQALEAIKKFAGDKLILEIGSGVGFWAKLLKCLNVNIKPTDFVDPNLYTPFNHFCFIENISNLKVLDEYPTEILMLCWTKTVISYDSLKKFKGKKLIYIGEEQGCKADDKFFQLLQNEWYLISNINIPNLDEAQDSVFLYIRKI